ncbi:MAG TPA: hypothetical protein VGE41_08025, partial [Verrucomicrobiae bacterium]
PKVCSPIITIKFKTEAAKAQLKKVLLRAGIYPSFIHYPSGPKGGFFRFAISSEHTQAQLKKLADVLTKFPRQS